MAEIDLSADESDPDTVRIGGVTELRTVDVASDGRIYVGKNYAGNSVTIALRIEDEQPENEQSEG